MSDEDSPVGFGQTQRFDVESGVGDRRLPWAPQSKATVGPARGHHGDAITVGQHCHPDDIRIDLVGVLAPPGSPVEVEHVEGVG